MDLIKEYLNNSIRIKQLILEDVNQINNIDNVIKVFLDTLLLKRKLIFAGNGGSMTDSAHIATELISKFSLVREPLNAIALGQNNALTSAIGNDFSYDDIFVKELKALAQKGDVFIAISTSGNSTNIINALNVAKELGLVTIGFCGQNPCLMDEMCDYLIKIPSDNTPIIQECYMSILHGACKVVEEKIFS